MSKRKPLTEAERLLIDLQDIESRLCDPECEGRCRVCPAEVVARAVVALTRSPEPC